MLAFVSVTAQKHGILRGTIIDAKSDRPLQKATIKVAGADIGAISDDNGMFQIKNLESGNYIMICSSIGYETVTQAVHFAGMSMDITIKMAPVSNELSAVNVNGLNAEQAEVKKTKENVMPVTVITAKEMENRAGNLNEILARQAGVQIRLSGGLGSDARISVRGLEGKRVQIFLDGNPLNTPDGSLGLNDLPVQIIERIEIYKGAVPAYLGGDGLGSAVNVIFKHRDVSYIDASISRQSYNTQLSNLIVKKTFDKQGIEVGVGVFDTRSDNNYVMKSPYQPGLRIERDHDKYHSLLAAVAVKFHKLWFDEIEIEGAYVGNRKQIQGIQQNIQHAETKGQSYVGLINFTRKNFAGGKLGLKYNLLLSKFDVRFIDTSAYSYNWDGTRIPSSIGKGELGNGPNLSTNLQRDLRQRFNLDYRINRDFTLNFNNTFRRVSSDPEDDVGNAFLGKNVYNYPGSLLNSITGLTLESRFLDERLLISTALKNYYNVVDGFNTSIYLNNSIPDKLRNTTNELGYTAGLRYSISKSFLAKASYEKGLRLPNNTELFGDGVLITPTTTLRPEIAHNYNVGLVFDEKNRNNRRLQIEANAFYMNVDNLIQLSGNGLTLGYVNYTKANIKGADLDIKYDVTKNVFAGFNATYQVLTDINRLIPATSVPNPSYNLQIPNTPQLFFNWNAEYHKRGILGHGSNTRLMYDGSFVAEYNYGFKISVYDNFVIPSYLTHTISLEQSLQESKYTITAEVNNISGKEILNNYNQPLPGRTFRIKLRMLLMGKANHDHVH